MTSVIPPAPARPASAPAVQSEQARRDRLALMKRRATYLLGAVSLVWISATIWGGSATWVGYVQATAEAAMVGGLADWFAVTALFRHPLNVPIPHTAIIVERKDQFAATLGSFVQETFLTPEVIIGRIRTASVIPRLADWLIDPEHAARVAAEILDGSVSVAEMFRDEDVQRVIEDIARERLDAIPLAPLAGRTLEFLIRDGRHQQALDVGLRELDRYLDEHRVELRGRVGKESPWWLPNAAEDRIFERLLDGARTLLDQMVADPDHALRQTLEDRLVALARDLQSSPDLLERGERFKQDLLAQPEVRAWVATMWQDAKAQLRLQAEDPASPLRVRLTGAIVSGGRRLHDDPALEAKLEGALETAVTYVVDRFHGEIVELVSGTIARWDGDETADRLELLLGPDLQYIRINGTVVGATAGLALYTIAQVLR